MALTVSLLSIKGGVGKTSAAVNLCAQAAISGLRTLLIDLDPQAAATYTLGVDDVVAGGARTVTARRTGLVRAAVATGWLGLDVVPADFSLRHLDRDLVERGAPRRRFAELVEAVSPRYDVVIIDCPPGLTLANEGACRASNAVLVPIVPATLPMRAFDQLDEFVRGKLKLRQVELLGFFSMVDRRKRGHRALVESIHEHDRRVLRSTIPNAVAIERMAELRSPILPTGRASVAAIAYRDLWQELQIRLIEGAGRPQRRRDRDA